MNTKYSPSVNIVRDAKHELDYIVTPNAEKIAHQIGDLYKKGIHSFNIIGSYGTGKSSFLWALDKSLKGNKKYFELNLSNLNNIAFISLVGEFESFRILLSEYLEMPEAKHSNKEIINELVTKSSNDTLLVLVVDEFGKFLEYAVKNNVDEELYFLQQLAEVINDPDNNCLFITTLHQSFDAYGHQGLTDAERNEWRKVKGRFKDLTFNEPIEQLLLLAATKLKSKKRSNNSDKILDLQSRFHIVNADIDFIKNISNDLFPLDVISAYLLCVSLQRYGQNERSLFTFFESELSAIGKHLEDGKQLGIPEIYDYVYYEFYSYLSSKYNIDYSGWSMIALALARIEVDIPPDYRTVSEDIIKVIGLINLFGHKGAHIEEDFLIDYLTYQYGSKNIKQAIDELIRIKVIRFNRFSKSFKIIEGTDLNIEDEILKISGQVENAVDITDKLIKYFDFPVINAKAVSYKKGTPRFFQYIISDSPQTSLPDDKQIDGVINLVFDTKINTKNIIEVSNETEEIIYASFLKIKEIRESIYDIEKTEKVLENNTEDRVAVKELQSILNSLRGLLNHQVLDALYTKDVEWYYAGEKVSIQSKKELNKKLSKLCEKTYPFCPTFNNELINRHLLSGSIASAKKILFDQLIAKYHDDNLGFPDDKFPAEKTIYLSLLKNTGIHSMEEGLYTLGMPTDKSFHELWKHSEAFIDAAKNERKRVSEFYEILSKKPFKLTSGLLEFWIPIFLFIKRDDYALFSKNEGYIPEIKKSILYLFTRTPQDYEIKSFDVKGIKLDLYNKYREFLQLKDVEKVNNQSLIESIKPFVVFHKELNTYAQNTKRLSKQSIQLRNTIATTQDPEKLFFEEFPKVIQMDLNEILESDKNLEDYVGKLRVCIKELRSCYDELVNRIEQYLVEEILQSKGLVFDDYKTQIMGRYAKLKEHMLRPEQASVLIRLNSPIDDRSSWINAICQVIVEISWSQLKTRKKRFLKKG